MRSGPRVPKDSPLPSLLHEPRLFLESAAFWRRFLVMVDFAKKQSKLKGVRREDIHFYGYGRIGWHF